MAGRAGWKKGKFLASANDGPERKFYDYGATLSFNTGNETAVVDLTALIAQGVTASQRLGNKINIKSINLKSTGITTGSAPQGIWEQNIVIDQQSNDAVPTYSQIYNTTAYPAWQTMVQAGRSTRFKVIDHHKGQSLGAYRTDAGIISAATGPVWDIYETFVPCDIGVQFETSSTDTPTTNALLFTFGTNAVTTSSPITIYVSIRITFTDA